MRPLRHCLVEQSGRGWIQTFFATYGGGLMEPGPDGGGSGSSGGAVAPMRNSAAKQRYRGSAGRNHADSAAKPSYAGRRRRRQPPYARIRRIGSVIPSTPQTSPQIALANRAKRTKTATRTRACDPCATASWNKMDVNGPRPSSLAYGGGLMELGPHGSGSGSTDEAAGRAASLTPLRGVKWA